MDPTDLGHLAAANLVVHAAAIPVVETAVARASVLEASLQAEFLEGHWVLQTCCWLVPADSAQVGRLVMA